MNKREARATITDLAQECHRLETENHVLREALSSLERRFFELVPLSCRLNADIMDQWFLLCKQLEKSGCASTLDTRSSASDERPTHIPPTPLQT